MDKIMTAAVLQEKGKIVLETREVPMVGVDDILVKIRHVGICGSDLHYYENGRIGDYIVRKPIILGHECAGEVISVGSQVKDIRAGDLVAIEPGYTCGKCGYCKSGLYNLCPDVVFMATPPYDGAFAEYITYPQDVVFKLPKGMSTLEGALIEPLTVGLHAVNQGNAKTGQSAVILGSGCIGLVTMMALKCIGINDIYVTDLIQKRLDMAKKLGAAGTFKADEVDLQDTILQLTNGKGVDMVFETAGSGITTQQTVELVKRGGTIILVGMAPEGIVQYNFSRLISKEASIKTVFRYRNLYTTAIKAVAQGLIPIKEIVTDTFKFDEISEALEYNSKNKDKVVKAVIEF